MQSSNAANPDELKKMTTFEELKKFYESIEDSYKSIQDSDSDKFERIIERSASEAHRVVPWINLLSEEMVKIADAKIGFELKPMPIMYYKNYTNIQIEEIILWMKNSIIKIDEAIKKAESESFLTVNIRSRSVVLVDEEPEYEVNFKLKNLIAHIELAKKIYHEKHAAKHKVIVFFQAVKNKLHNDAESKNDQNPFVGILNTFNFVLAEKNQSCNEVFLKQVIFLLSEFEKKMNKHVSKDTSNHTDAAKKNDFIFYLNQDKQKKGHHFTRLLGLVLNSMFTKYSATFAKYSQNENINPKERALFALFEYVQKIDKQYDFDSEMKRNVNAVERTSTIVFK